MSPKIIELIIEDGDEQAGLDGIALVEQPAHEALFEYFNQEEEKPCENGNCNHYVLSDDKVPHVIQMFHSFGEPQGFLETEGWEITSIKNVRKNEFALISNPNQPSAQDTPNVRFRYKYVGPKDDKNRTFCAEMMGAKKVFRIEDIIEMSNLSVNEVGPDGYDIFTWRGSYNCRHKWVQLIYEPQGRIINNDRVDTGLIDEDGMPGPDTRTTATIDAGNTPARTGFNATNPDVSALSPYVDQVSKDDYQLEDACWEGYEPIGLKIGADGKEVPNCVPVNEAMDMFRQEFQSYNDYPESARNNACKAIRWKEEYGDEVQGMTQIGWIRANQLCKGENISEETIARMSGFQRHQKNAEVAPEYKDTPWKDKGYVAWLGWGGTTGINWASDKLKSIRNEMSFSVFNSEQKLVIGPAMIPNKMIIRRNEITGEVYYVYFTEETIKKLQQKYMLEKLLDKTNVEHGRKFLNGVSIIESWIVDNPNMDKQQVFGMDYPKGTWMITMKVEDDSVWQKVKEGKLKGFSVQGFFLEKAKFASDSTKILEEIKEILKQVK